MSRKRGTLSGGLDERLNVHDGASVFKNFHAAGFIGISYFLDKLSRIQPVIVLFLVYVDYMRDAKFGRRAEQPEIVTNVILEVEERAEGLKQTDFRLEKFVKQSGETFLCFLLPGAVPAGGCIGSYILGLLLNFIDPGNQLRDRLLGAVKEARPRGGRRCEPSGFTRRGAKKIFMMTFVGAP